MKPLELVAHLSRPAVQAWGLALVSALGFTAALIAGNIQAGVPAGITTLGIAALGLAVHRREPPSGDRGRAISKAAELAARGRRLAIYERDTGLLAHWYMELRTAEECARALRYGKKFAVLVLEADPEADARLVLDNLPEHLKSSLRSSDLPSYLGYARFAVLLPEAEEADALKVLARAIEAVPGTRGRFSVFPGDGDSFQSLCDAAKPPSALTDAA